MENPREISLRSLERMYEFMGDVFEWILICVQLC